MPERVKTYNSPLREEQARRTRERILQAARDTFGKRGYGVTTLADIARAAGVAEPTVRAVFKTKPSLLKQLHQAVVRGGGEAVPLDRRDPFQQMLASPDAATLLARLTELNEAIHRRAWDVSEIIRGAASSDPEIAELQKQRIRARHENQTKVAKRLKQLGALPEHTTVEAAADLLWLYTAHENYRMLVIERNWSASRYRNWFHAAIANILTKPTEAQRPQHIPSNAPIR